MTSARSLAAPPRSPRRGWRAVAALTLALASPAAHSQVSRCDLAAMLVRVDDALAAFPPREPDHAAVDGRFDRASLSFFAGGADQALADLAGLVLELEGRTEDPGSRAFLSLRVEARPFVLVDGEAGPITIAVRRAAAPTPDDDDDDDDPRGDDGEAVALESDLAAVAERARAARVVARREPRVADGEVTVAAGLPLDALVDPDRGAEALEVSAPALRDLPPGRWWIALVRDDGLRGPATPFVRTRAALEDAAEAAIAIAESRPADPGAAALRARAELLTAARPRDETTRFVEDLAALQAAVLREATAIARGDDPYRDRAGDLWLPVTAGARSIACRFFVPPRDDDAGREPRPLVVALHGAGGDENMFAFAYGGGALLRAASARDVIVAAPLTYRVLGADPGAALDAIVDAADRLHPVDRARVHVLGHSLGSGAAAAVAAARPRAVASVALLMGGGSFTRGVPTLVVGAERDPLAPGDAILGRARSAAAEGFDVATLRLAGRGHTLAVGDVLPEVVDWLLARPR